MGPWTITHREACCLQPAKVHFQDTLAESLLHPPLPVSADTRDLHGCPQNSLPAAFKTNKWPQKANQHAWEDTRLAVGAHKDVRLNPHEYALLALPQGASGIWGHQEKTAPPQGEARWVFWYRFHFGVAGESLYYPSALCTVSRCPLCFGNTKHHTFTDTLLPNMPYPFPHPPIVSCCIPRL